MGGSKPDKSSKPHPGCTKYILTSLPTTEFALKMTLNIPFRQRPN